MPKRRPNYTEEEKARALAYYHECKSATKTIRDLGYPVRSCMNTWIANEGKPKLARKKNSINKGMSTFEERLDVVHRCVDLGEDVHLIAKEFNRDVTTIYAWCRIYKKEGHIALMKKTKKKQPATAVSEIDNIEELKTQMLELQLENDILRETINVLKKDPGINQAALTNREKAVIVDALKDKYSLPLLLEKLQFSKSSYYYQEKCLRKPDKYLELRKRVREIFYENKERYGYRRIWAILSFGENAIKISEKVIRRIMKEEGLVAKRPSVKKYSSYKGEITPAVADVVKRNFHADKPNELWLTDITEFAIPAGKIYLSALVDCFDGLLPTWTIGLRPNAELVNTMLDNGIALLNDSEHPIVHTDRGCHYRWPGWIKRMEEAGLTRSMSKKGCSPDNSACEGVFGRLKNEMFYGVDWKDVTIDEFIQILNDYLVWYNEDRIKQSLDYLSPTDYRKNLGLACQSVQEIVRIPSCPQVPSLSTEHQELFRFLRMS